MSAIDPASAQPVRIAPTEPSSVMRRLVAGRVYAQSSPRTLAAELDAAAAPPTDSSAFPLYASPARRNEVATALGRSLDVKG